jgi:FG-GAP-like repeat/ASPIC and UnbV
MRLSSLLACLAITVTTIIGGAAYWVLRPVPDGRATSSAPGYPSSTFPTLADPNAPGTSARIFLDPAEFDSGVFSETARYSNDLPRDSSSLPEYRKAVAGRVVLAKARLDEQGERLKLGPNKTLEQIRSAIELCRDHAFVALYEGNHDDASTWLARGLELAKAESSLVESRAQMMALLGLNALRRGEQDNCIACVGPSSCIFPIAKGAVHTRPSGSREAVKWFTEYLDEWPGDLRVRWLLNIAYMTLGEHPAKVPPQYLIPVAAPGKAGVSRFENVASLVGLVARGPDLAGGCLFDDFNGDGRPDVFTTTFDVNHGASLYINRGDGKFEDRSVTAGLDDQVYSLNASRADYDNDGDLDILMLRGAWEKAAPMSLLRNKGDGTFEDVTAASGLGEPIASESGAWGDFDDDGHLDLFVCGEHVNPRDRNPTNYCRLYRNRGDGTFENVADKAGVENKRWAKGSAWGDYDGDGRLDLFVSNMGSAPRLYHNNGNGTFRDVAPSLGIEGPPHGFACMFWDYDNDGRPDIFICNWGGSLSDFVANYLGLSEGSPEHAKLYHNLGKDGFREVSHEVGLDRPVPVMSVNAGDIDNDGDLDLHLGTGWMSLSGLVPDLTYINAGGRFEDVTDPTGTGHLQKGHGVSFADWDDDGDLDLFVVLGGGYPGDRGYNALFQNPLKGRHWLKVRLVGTKSNRSAIGAKIRVDLKGADGTTRSIHRVIGNNGSFGGNSLVELIGLGDSSEVDRLTVTWPGGKTSQTLLDLEADRSIVITEGTDAPKVLPHRPLPQPGG